MYRISIIFSILFIAAVAVLLVTSNVRWAFNALPLYELGFSRHQVAITTGFSQTQLTEAARQIRDYFNSSEELLDVRVSSEGVMRPLYNDREVSHMQDVKDLATRIYRVQEGAFLYSFLFVTVGFLIMGNEFSGRLRRLLVRGCLLTAVLVALVAVISLVGFGPLFVFFHEISFSNDLWRLDPNTSALVQMFPQGFWLETTVLIGVASVVEAGAILILLSTLGAWRRWRSRVAQSKVPRFF